MGLLLRILAVGMWTGDVFGSNLLIALRVDDSAFLVVCFVSMLSVRGCIEVTMSCRQKTIEECIALSDCWRCRFLEAAH